MRRLVTKRRSKVLSLLLSFAMVFTMMPIAIMTQSVKVEASASVTPAAEYDSLPLNIRENCVSFARYKVPSLPSGLKYKE